LRGETWRYFGDIGLPLLATMGIATVGRLVFADLSSPFVTLACISSVWLGCLVVAVLAAPHIRSWVVAQVMSAKLQYGNASWKL
jgi:hypothetical protein